MLSSDRLREHRGENSSLLLDSLVGVEHWEVDSDIALLPIIEGFGYLKLDTDFELSIGFLHTK